MGIKSWTGGAGPIRQQSTITMAGTFAADDVVNVKIGPSMLISTVGAAVATTDIAQLVMAAINAASATASLVGDESRNVGGQELPEFQEVSATASGAVVTVTGLLGVPFTLVASETTAGDGTATGAVAQAATGPHHFDEADNWAGGVLPIAADTIRFDGGAVDCSYGLDYLATNTLECDLEITTDYTGRVGLPGVRAATANSATYTEYRDWALALYDVGSTITVRLNRGDQGGVGGIIALNLEDFDGATIVVEDAGTIKAEPGLVFYGGASTACYVGTGWIVIDPEDSGVTTGHELGGLIVGAMGLADNLTRVALGSTVQFDASITGTFNSGSTEIQVLMDQGADEMVPTIYGGVVESFRVQAHTAVAIRGGTYQFSGSGTMAGVVSIYDGGTLDLSRTGQTQSYAGGITMYGGSTLLKGGHTVTPTLVGCNEDQVNITA